MVASTYSSGESSPDKVVYGEVNLAANHAYSILGVAYHNCKRYIMLRNPWANTEASSEILTADYWSPYRDELGNPIPLAEDDGVFGIHVETFKKYFKSWGVITI